jgi:hypothetical protein
LPAGDRYHHPANPLPTQGSPDAIQLAHTRLLKFDQASNADAQFGQDFSPMSLGKSGQASGLPSKYAVDVCKTSD